MGISTMIAEAKPKPHRHRSETRHYDRERDDLRKLVINQESEDLGRTVAVHLAGHNFDVARLVIDRAEREYHQAKFRPARTKDVTLDQLGLQERTVVKLYDNRYRNLADLLACSDEDILSIRQFGPATLAEIRSRAEYWLDRIAGNLTAQ
jgi:DNA-directed RNA polymerase alpha subunit